MQLGLATFADLGSAATPEQRMSDLMEEVESLTSSDSTSSVSASITGLTS